MTMPTATAAVGGSAKVFRFLPQYGALLVVTLVLAGCSGSEAPPEAPEKDSASASNQNPPAPVQPPRPDPHAVWSQLATKAQTQLAADELDAAAETVQALDNVFEAPEKPTAEQLAQREVIQQQIEVRRREVADQRRQAALEQVKEHLAVGDLEAATRSVDAVLIASPTDEQRAAALRFQAEIERRRRARVRLMTAMKLLGSESRAEVRTAQNQLAQEPETSLPLLFEAVRDPGKPTLVTNALEMLRRLKRPEVTLPVMVDVLRRAELEKNWTDAVAEIRRVAAPGAGELLLELALQSNHPQQRTLALQALSQVVDPPPQTVVALLPILGEDGPELAAALQAAYHAVRTHRQYDLLSQRGLNIPLNEDQARQIAELGVRLSQLAASAAEGEENEVAHAARVLAVATHLMPAEPLAGVTIHSVSAEIPESPGAGALDGTFNSIEPSTWWRHPANERGVLVLDLGQERTVAGVRIWNLNHPSGTQYGWKEVDIFVSAAPQSLDALEPVAQGIVPRAPGAADVPDYSTRIDVEFVRGRYVKLQFKSAWQADAPVGISEVQVLGF